MSSVHKSMGNVDNQFDQKQFNKTFENDDKLVEKVFKQNSSHDMIEDDEAIYNRKVILPHQRPVEDIVVSVRNMFFDAIEGNYKNAIDHVNSTPDRFFAFALICIVIGSLLLLLSNLMKSSEKKI